MSLNKTLDRLFDEIRREAKRNPDFANRMDAVLRSHDSRRDVPADVLVGADVSPASVEPDARSAPEAGRGPKRRPAAAPVPPQAGKSTPSLNPAGLYRKEGEEGLRGALEAQDLGALRALVAEHNLDPSGVTPSLTRDELAAHVISQAKRRAERDEKMFDY